MEKDNSWKEQFSSETLDSLFGFETKHTTSEDVFGRYLLEAMQFKDLLRRIKLLASGIELIRKWPGTKYFSESGAIYVFEVDVLYEHGRPEIKEKNPLEKEHFFASGLENITRVIFVRSKSIRVIDAKLLVYRKYSKFVSSRNILVHHELEDLDDICKLCAAQKLKYFQKLVTLMADIIPDASLEGIVQKAAEQDFEFSKIQEICYGVVLRDGTTLVGTVHSSPYRCYFAPTVRRLKDFLVHKTLDNIANNLGGKICVGILEDMKRKVILHLRHELDDVDFDISSEMFSTFEGAVKSIVISAFFDPVSGFSEFVLELVLTYFWSVDVNSESWRGQVVRKIWECISKRKGNIFNGILPEIKHICNNAKSDLSKIANQIMQWRNTITVPDQSVLIHEWEKRERIQKTEALNHPAILTCITGIKNGKSVVKVFLRYKNKEAKKFFKENSSLPDDTQVKFINIAKTRNDISDMMQETIAPTITENERSKLRTVIKSQGEKLMANHSSIVGLGSGSLKSKYGLYIPCIVLHCLDDSLIPFGEKPLPSDIEGFPVHIKQDFVIFGNCTNCSSLRNGCGIGRPSCYSTGSVGFPVRPNNPFLSSTTGFLTAAHVAVKEFSSLYETNTLLSQHPLQQTLHEIVHPPYEDTENNNKIGDVIEAFCGNFGRKRIGMDAAFVKLCNPNKKKQVAAVLPNEQDLKFDGSMKVIKWGRATDETIGVLVQESFGVCLHDQFNYNRFLFFEECYAIRDFQKSIFFKVGDSGSGVYLYNEYDMQNSLKPLGIAFARMKDLTAVCKIKDILDAFDISVHLGHSEMGHEAMDVDT